MTDTAETLAVITPAHSFAIAMDAARTMREIQLRIDAARAIPDELESWGVRYDIAVETVDAFFRTIPADMRGEAHANLNPDARRDGIGVASYEFAVIAEKYGCANAWERVRVSLIGMDPLDGYDIMTDANMIHLGLCDSRELDA